MNERPHFCGEPLQRVVVRADVERAQEGDDGPGRWLPRLYRDGGGATRTEGERGNVGDRDVANDAAGQSRRSGRCPRCRSTTGPARGDAPPPNSAGLEPDHPRFGWA